MVFYFLVLLNFFTFDYFIKTKADEIRKKSTRIPSLVSESKLKERSRDLWLNDLDVNKVQILLKEKFGFELGLEDPLILAHFPCKIKKRKVFIRILFDSANDHWVCLTTLGSEPGQAFLYDSLKRTNITGELANTICQTLPDGEDRITIKVITAQEQTGNWQCGYFALANATALCFNLKPENLSFDENILRQHYIDMIINNSKLTMPPYVVKKKPHSGRDNVIFLMR